MLIYSKDSKEGLLFPGIHILSWQDFVDAYSFSDRRKHLFQGMKRALSEFKKAGCQRVYIDGSFAAKKTEPNDYDACWDISGVDLALLDPILYNLSRGTKMQKLKYYGEFFPASCIEGVSGITFLDFFQIDRTGKSKGIIQIELGGVM